MNENKCKISFIRIFGVGGICFSIIVGFMLAGGNPLSLFMVSVWLIVLGVTWFALLATFGTDFLRFCWDAFLALFLVPEPNEKYVDIAENGSRYAVGAGFLAFLTTIMTNMCRIDGPNREFWDSMAASLVGLFIGVVLGKLFFPFLAKSYRGKGELS